MNTKHTLTVTLAVSILIAACNSQPKIEIQHAIKTVANNYVKRDSYSIIVKNNDETASDVIITYFEDGVEFHYYLPQLLTQKELEISMQEFKDANGKSLKMQSEFKNCLKLKCNIGYAHSIECNESQINADRSFLEKIPWWGWILIVLGVGTMIDLIGKGIKNSQ